MLETIFKSEQMTRLVEKAKIAANSFASVFITGENGVGKEHIAHILHDSGPRAKSPFIAVNCAALPNELIEAELFGSKKGSYTGAFYDRIGLFRQAEDGTIFLDEISEMPITMQSKLLRVLQDRKVRPVGGVDSYGIGCRVIAATNLPVDEALALHKLRLDLYYRLAVISLHIPALRERRDDIEALTRFFFKKYQAEEKKDITLDDNVIPLLRENYWQGNVRQLQNAIQQAVIFAPDGKVTVQQFSYLTTTKSEDTFANVLVHDEDYNLENVTKKVVQSAKRRFATKEEMAKKLGISRGTLYEYLKRYGSVNI